MVAVTLAKLKDFIGYAETGLIKNKFNVPSDQTLQLILDQATQTCLNIIGKATEPETETFESSVYWFTNYLVRTRSIEENRLEFKQEGLFQERTFTPGLEKGLHRSVLQKLTGMLANDRDVTQFIPGSEDDSTN